MITKIRPSCFETNSSSMDRYDDYDDGPRYAKGRQTIRVSFDFDKDADVDAIMNKLSDDDKVISFIMDNALYIMADDDIDEIEYDDADDDTLNFTCVVIADVIVRGRFIPATRYEPAEHPDYEFDYEGFPTAKETCSSRAKAIQLIDDKLKKEGYVGIRTAQIYGVELNDDDFTI